jgi:hypothetical protein
MVWFRVMTLNATFNNISVISWRSVLFVEETRLPGEHHRPVENHWQTLSHNVESSTPNHELGSNSQLHQTSNIYHSVAYFQQYFSYIMVARFIGGWNWSIQRKPSICHKSLTNLITECIEYTLPWTGSFFGDRQWLHR